MKPLQRWFALPLAFFGAAASFAQAPLDIFDPEPRTVYVQVENSVDRAIVGQSFGPPVPATYYVNGNTGTLVLSKQSHKQMRLGYFGFTGSANLFSPIVFEFNLTTLEVTSQSASGGFRLGRPPYGLSSRDYVQNPLSTDSVGGFTQTDLFCTSQAYVDDLCNANPNSLYCGETCTVVPGEPYDPSTGLMNLVGSEYVVLCAQFYCADWDGFSKHGDLLVTEIPDASGLPNRPAAVIPVAAIMALVAGFVLFRMRRCALHQN